MKTDHLFLSVDECKLLKRARLRLESAYHVKIIMPEITNSTLNSDKEIICASVIGESSDIISIKEFVQSELVKLQTKRLKQFTIVDNVPTIMLSDSDSPTENNVVVNNVPVVKKKKKSKRKHSQILSPAAVRQGAGNTVSSSTEPGNRVIKKRKIEACSSSSESTIVNTGSSNSGICQSQEADDSIIVLPTKEISKKQTIQARSSSKESTIVRRAANSNPAVCSQEADDSIIVLPTEEVSIIEERRDKHHSKGNDSIILLSNEDFIPLSSGSKNNQCQRKSNADDSIIVVEESLQGTVRKSNPENMQISRPLPRANRKPRPIVIDGSNVARTHGKKDNNYSCQGIKISIEYFLQRGHTQVTAFVPNFRRHVTSGSVITTHADILEELAVSQHVVFTPSRRLNGKRVTCYDDRFIVELATQSGGVILSNDNYKDLMEESASFKKTIQERLLMFCFVGDMLMCPNDPLGRDGPCLQDFLLFPSDED